MTNVLDLIHDILDVAAGNYTNYGAKPNIKIERKEDLFYMEPGHVGIIIGDAREDPSFLCNGSALYTSVEERMCKLQIAEKDTDDLDNLIADIKSLFENSSSYSVQYQNIEYIYNRPLYSATMEVKLL